MPSSTTSHVRRSRRPARWIRTSTSCGRIWPTPTRRLAATKSGQEQQDLYGKAIEAFGRRSRSSPTTQHISTTTDLLLARAKKVPEAEEELKKAAALDPPNAGKYYYNLGAVLPEHRPV